MSRKSRIVIFASGGGTNAEKIIKYFRSHPSIEVVLVLSNNPWAFVLTRAETFGIETNVFDRQQFTESQIVLGWLRDKEVTHVVLAGFLWLIPGYLIDAFPDRIINIHPALLPAYGGKGMYGMKVHEAVRNANEKETGITIHLVNKKYDDGRVLFQAKCPVGAGDTPEQIAEKVHCLEYESYPRVIEKWILG